MKKLAIITTHPIQYNAPLYQLLAQRKNIQVKVFYTWGEKAIDEKFDSGFGKTIKWDIPLLEGYDYEFLENTSKNPGSHSFNGIINPRIIEKIEAFKSDAILVYGWSFKSHLKVLRFFKGKKKIFFRGDSTLLDEPQKITFKKLLRRIFLTWIYSYIDTALYVGENNKNYFLKHKVKSNSLVYAPHCIDNDRFNEGVDENFAAELRKELNIKADDFVFLYVGKFESKKNPMLLLKAFCSLRINNAHLIFVGNGKLENDLKESAEKEKNIHFLPFQNQTKIPSVYHLANFIVLPSRGPGETWGLVINEAMACGRPTIASNKVGCTIDLIEDGITGFRFESENEVSLQKALQKAYDNRNNFQQFSNNSLNKISNFSLKKTAMTIENTLLRL